MTDFMEINPDGTTTVVRTIPQEAFLKCPHVIIHPDHYREDNTCRCDDEAHTLMREWGYVWAGQSWV